MSGPVKPMLRRRPQATTGCHRFGIGLLAAAGALALAACQAVPGGQPPPRQSPDATTPAPVGSDRSASGQQGMAGQPGQPDQPGQPGQPGPPGQAGQPGQLGPAQPPVAPERTIALLATRQLRCADPGPQAQDPQQAIGAAFRDEAQWRAHLAAIAPGMRAALASFRVDFNAGESALLVRPGALPNLGYRIAIPQERLPVTAGTLGVQVLVEPPPSRLLQAQVIAFPCVYLRLAGADYAGVAIDVERVPAP